MSGVSVGVAGALVLRPTAMPDGLDKGYGYMEACADLGVNDPPDSGVAVWALYAPKTDGSGLGQLSVVTTLIDETEFSMGNWSDDIICGLPEVSDSTVLHMAEGWVHTGYMTLHPVYAALGWTGVCAQAIQHPPPDTSDGEHHPIRRSGKGRHAGFWTVGCDDCDWSQRVDDELLDNGADRLMDWHAAYPKLGVNHMGKMPPHHRLAVPLYVEWTGLADKVLVIEDKRTGLLHRRGRWALDIYKTLLTDGRLAPPGHIPDNPVMAEATRLFRWALLSRDSSTP